MGPPMTFSAEGCRLLLTSPDVCLLCGFACVVCSRGLHDGSTKDIFSTDFCLLLAVLNLIEPGKTPATEPQTAKDSTPTNNQDEWFTFSIGRSGGFLHTGILGGLGNSFFVGIHFQTSLHLEGHHKSVRRWSSAVRKVSRQAYALSFSVLEPRTWRWVLSRNNLGTHVVQSVWTKPLAKQLTYITPAVCQIPVPRSCCLDTPN